MKQTTGSTEDKSTHDTYKQTKPSYQLILITPNNSNYIHPVPFYSWTAAAYLGERLVKEKEIIGFRIKCLNKK